MIIVFYNQGIRYGMVNTVLPLYFLFSLLIILNYIALRTVEYHLILNSCLGLMYCLKSGIPYLDNSDIENNIPNPINSKYFYLHDFEKLTLSPNKSYFSLFYVNLNSWDAHLDALHATSDLLGFPFQVIGVSETRENVLRGFKIMIMPCMAIICIRSLPDQLQVVLLFTPANHWMLSKELILV